MSSSRWLILILILAALLRFYGLGAESFWLDETFTAHNVKMTYPDLLRYFSHETQTILYYLIQKAWCDIAGLSEFVLRIPALIFGLLSVLGTYLLARELFSRSAALYSALFMTVNPFCIFYSQDARPYSLFLAAAVFSFYFGLLVLRCRDWKTSLGYVACTVAVLYAHPLAPLVFGVHFTGYVLFRRAEGYQPARITSLLGLSGLSALLYIPQIILIKNAFFAKTTGVSGASWIELPGMDSFSTTFRQFFMNPGLGYVVLTIFVLALFVGFSDIRKQLKGVLYLTAVAVCMMVGPWIVSHLITPVYVHRYVIPALAAFVIGLGWSVTVLPCIVRLVAVTAVVIITSLTLYDYYSGADKDPWRQTAQVLREIARPGDHIVVNPVFAMPALEYYKPPSGIPVTPARTPVYLLPTQNARRLILVLSYDILPDENQIRVLEEIEKNRFVRSSRSLTAELRRNPWAYWISDIRVIVYERPDVPVSGGRKRI